MAAITIDLNGVPWMVCDPDPLGEIEDVVRKSGIDPRDVTTRAADPREAAKLAAEKALTDMRGGDPDKIFGVSL